MASPRAVPIWPNDDHRLQLVPLQHIRRKRRFQLEDLEGLKDLPPIAKSHPTTMPPEVVARIEELARARARPGQHRRSQRAKGAPWPNQINTH